MQSPIPFSQMFITYLRNLSEKTNVYLKQDTLFLFSRKFNIPRTLYNVHTTKTAAV